MPKVDKGYEPPKRTHVFLNEEEIAAGKKPQWQELEIVSPVKNLSSKLWQLSHLTALYLSKNNLTRVPPDIAKLKNLIHLDLSYNKLRSLPTELGDMIQLRELLLNHNHLRVLPYELGRLFQLQVLGISGNPIQAEILSMVSEPNGTARLVSFLLDNLQSVLVLVCIAFRCIDLLPSIVVQYCEYPPLPSPPFSSPPTPFLLPLPPLPSPVQWRPAPQTESGSTWPLPMPAKWEVSHHTRGGGAYLWACVARSLVQLTCPHPDLLMVLLAPLVCRVV